MPKEARECRHLPLFILEYRDKTMHSPLGAAQPTVSTEVNTVIRPEFFRLPKNGERDPFFGLPRSTYYELEKEGAISLKRLKKRGALRGTTLLPYDETLAYIRSLN